MIEIPGWTQWEADEAVWDQDCVSGAERKKRERISPRTTDQSITTMTFSLGYAIGEEIWK